MSAHCVENRWVQGIPTKNGYYWVYCDEYDLMWFCQRINNKFIWFYANGVDKMTPSKGIKNFKKDGHALWWWRIVEPELPT